MELDDLIDLYSQMRTFVALSLHQDCRFTGPITLEPIPRREDSDGDSHPYVAPYEFHAVWARGTRHSYDLYNRAVSSTASAVQSASTDPARVIEHITGPGCSASWRAQRFDCHDARRIGGASYRLS